MLAIVLFELIVSQSSQTASRDLSENKNLHSEKNSSYLGSNDQLDNNTIDEDLLSKDSAYDTVDQAILKSVYQP